MAARTPALPVAALALRACPVCLEASAPAAPTRLVPCLHSLCAAWVGAVAEQGEGTGCPVSRAEFPVPEGGVPQLPASSVVDMDSVPVPDPGPAICDMCIDGGIN